MKLFNRLSIRQKLLIMRYLIVSSMSAVVLFLVLSNAATAGEILDKFEVKPTHRLAVTSTLIVLDSFTTYYGLEHGAHEANPLLGSHPSNGRQALLLAGKIGINWLVLTKTEESTQRAWTWAVVIVEGVAGVNNLIVIQREW